MGDIEVGWGGGGGFVSSGTTAERSEYEERKW